MCRQVWPLRESLVKLVEENQVVVLSGETGSGKTTQMPQVRPQKWGTHSYLLFLVEERKPAYVFASSGESSKYRDAQML
jgi:hypothetical protein